MRLFRTCMIPLFAVISPLILLISVTQVRAIGDDYCFASVYKNLGFFQSLNYWIFDWVPTFSFLPIHIAMFFGRGGDDSFAFHSIILFFLNSLIMFAIASQYLVASFKMRIYAVLFSWNIVILFLGTVSPLTSKIWYATHWGLTIGHFTPSILGMLIVLLALKDKGWNIVVILSFWMSQLSAPAVISWVLAITIYLIYKKRVLIQSVKQKLIVSALIQSIFSLFTVLYTKFGVTDRSDSFSGTQSEIGFTSFLISYARLLFHQILATNGLFNNLVCFAIAIIVYASLSAKMNVLIGNEIFPMIVLSTFFTYLIIPAADAYAYGAPWHNLQVIILSSFLKTVLFYRIISLSRIKRYFRFKSGVGAGLTLSLFSLSIFFSFSILIPNLERTNEWKGRWVGESDVNLSLIPKTFQNQPLQGDIESEWINDCFKKWRV